jgi:hypothetical protein
MTAAGIARYDPAKHHRRSIRQPGHDYAAGARTSSRSIPPSAGSASDPLNAKAPRVYDCSA